MINYLIENGYNWDGSTEGNKVAKSLASTIEWSHTPTEGSVGLDPEYNNLSGFSGLPAGYIRHTVINEIYHSYTHSSRNMFGSWWANTGTSIGRATFFQLGGILPRLSTGFSDNNDLVSIRLVRDLEQ